MIIATMLTLIVLTGPDGQRIYVNPAEVVSVRGPRGEGHFASDIHCLVGTVDGKFIAVVESCDIVKSKLKAEE